MPNEPLSRTVWVPPVRPMPDTENTALPLIEGCRLAYVAHNGPDWAEFIVDVPTPLSDTIKVHHYSEVERMDGTVNRMIEVE